MGQSKSITKGVAAGDDEVETGDGEVREISNGLTTEDEALALALEQYVPDTDAERRLRWKVDIVLIPSLWWLYILAYLDRGNIANAASAGLNDDLNLSDDMYAWVISIFFIGYLIFEIPSNLILTRIQPSTYLTTIMFAWGIVVASMAAVQSGNALLGCRFLIGCIEAGLFPGALYVMTCWYKRDEVGKRFCIFFTSGCVAPALGGIMAGAVIGHLDGAKGLAGWRWLLIIEGAVTVVCAVIFKFILLDYPLTTKRFSIEERRLAAVRILHDRKLTSVMESTKMKPLDAFIAGIADPRSWIFLVLFVLDIGSCTVSYFIPTILKNMGYTSVSAQWMTVPIWATGAVVMLLLSISSDRFLDRHWHVTATLGLAFVSAVVLIATRNDSVRYGMICLYIAGLYTGVPLILNWTSETISLPPEKRAVVIALVNSVGNLSSVYGSRLWPSSDGPHYTKGFVVTATFTGAATLLAAMIPLALRLLPKEGVTKAEKEIRARVIDESAVARPAVV